MAGGQADAFRLLVHLPEEAVARHDAIRESLRGVVPGIEEQAVQKVAYCDPLARRQAHDARDDLGCLFRHLDRPVERTCVIHRNHRGHKLGQARRSACGLGVALPQHLARIEIDEIRRLTVDREVGLSVRREPVGREFEMVEGFWCGSGGALEVENERHGTCVRDKHRGRDRGRDDTERQEKPGELAPAPASRPRPRYSCFRNVGWDGGYPLVICRRDCTGPGQLSGCVLRCVDGRGRHRGNG